MPSVHAQRGLHRAYTDSNRGSSPIYSLSVVGDIPRCNAPTTPYTRLLQLIPRGMHPSYLSFDISPRHFTFPPKLIDVPGYIKIINEANCTSVMCERHNFDAEIVAYLHEL